MKHAWCGFFLLLLWSVPAQALTLDDVLRTSYRHAPQIQAELAKLEAERGRIQQRQGAFDWEMNSSLSGRVGGSADGGYFDSQVTRRLQDSNTKLYGGYRVSDGTLPIYENYYDTTGGGEFNAGVVFALLRDRIIDEERFLFSDAVLAAKQQESDTLLATLRTQYEAIVAYLDWLAASKRLSVMEALLVLAEDRQQGLSTQHDYGDVAKIYLTENQQYLLQRRAAVTDAERQQKNAAARLSLYYRDAKGQPLTPTAREAPKAFPSLTMGKIDTLEEIERVRAIRPEQIRVDLGIARERKALQLQENATLPKLDLALEGVQNMGDARLKETGPEARALITLSIPLQQNEGLGGARRSRALLRQLEEEKQLLNERIAAEIQLLANDIEAASAGADFARQEVEAAVAMRKAERERFDYGAADFFVLNMREEKEADAKAKLINEQLALHKAMAGYYVATLKTDQLLPKDN